MKLLIADDEKNIRKVLKNELAGKQIDIDEAENGVRAMELLEQGEYDVLLLDLNMPGLGGIEVLKKIRSLDLPTEVIILTANATISSAVEAMKLGAYDFVTKPCHIAELSPLIEKAHEKKKLRNENRILRSQIQRHAERHRMVFESKVMADLLDTVKKIAQSDFPVLITGESGVGKELIALNIHRESNRSGGPFLPINCGAIPETMIESELFGYEKGAFTGAIARRQGLLEMADTGTLFLDEIGDMPLALQVRLLRVIETGIFFRLGGSRELNVDVRVISATNKDLKKEAEQGAFRQDLFFRIATFTVRVPPLRERRTDIPLLVEYLTSSHTCKKKRFSPEALRLISAYAWPGNVRELKSVVHRALILSQDDIIGPQDLPADLAQGARTAGLRLEDVEREHILRVLKASGGQRGKAAEALGINPKTLQRKLAAFGIEG